MAEKRLALVSGAGVGLGQVLLEKFEANGDHPVGLGRTGPEGWFGEYRSLGFADTDHSRHESHALSATYGPPGVVVHNTAELEIAPFTEITLENYQTTWMSMVQSLVILAQAVLQPKGSRS